MSKTEDIRQVAIEHHHRMAPEFEAWYDALEKDRFANAFTYGRAKLDRMVDDIFASLPKGAAVLDIGCGTGEHLKRAQRHGLKPLGVEPAAAMIESARHNIPDAELHQGVATDLPIDDARVDAVLMVEVLRYLDRSDIRKALEEARRVLRPGGILFVTLVNRWAFDGFYIHQWLRQRRKGKEFDAVNPFCEFFSPGEAERELREAGFVDVRTEGRLFAPLRLAYKANEGLGRRLAALLEPLDDRVHRWRWTRGVAGHLIAIGRVPK